MKVAFYIFTNGRQTLGLNLTERFSITDNALENMPWPDMDVYDATKMFKSKLRFQIRHGDFRQRISQDEEDINSILVTSSHTVHHGFRLDILLIFISTGC